MSATVTYIIRVKAAPGESLAGRYIHGPRPPAEVRRLGYFFGNERAKAWPFPSRKQAAQKARIVERHMSQSPGWMEVVPACSNDTDGDGNCHLCHRRGGCPNL